MISLQKVSLSIDTKELFEDITITIPKTAKIGLVGFNGSGKTSFIKMLAGELRPDKGEVTLPKGFMISVMPQFTPVPIKDKIIFDAVKESAMHSHEDYEIDAILYKLGFEYETIYEKTVGSLSGGWQKLVLLAIALIDNPDLLLMDEPTNHMDFRAKAELDTFLSRNVRIPYIVVSHDRDFLDRNTNQTLFLRDKTIYNFPMPFSLSRENLLKRDISALETRRTEEKEIKRLENSAKRLAFWGKVYNNESAARASKSMQKKIEHLNDSKTFVTKENGARLRIGTKTIRANRTLKIINHTIYNPKNELLFHIDELEILPKDRIVLLGKNGVGKSTLIHNIYTNFKNFSKKLAYDESYLFNPQIDIGIFDQELTMIDHNEKVINLLAPLFGNPHLPQIMLKSAGLPGEYEYKRVKELSGGERARLQLIILEKLYYPLLLLDEPTSHLDIVGIEDLESNLVDNQATCLFTSHDRRFVENVANRFFVIENKLLFEVNTIDQFYNTQEVD